MDCDWIKRDKHVILKTVGTGLIKFILKFSFWQYYGERIGRGKSHGYEADTPEEQ
jgi:hypothetical protein